VTRDQPQSKPEVYWNSAARQGHAICRDSRFWCRSTCLWRPLWRVTIGIADGLADADV